MIINISGASGVGKSTLVARLISFHPERYTRLVTYTTRLIRPEEIDGISYHFVDAGKLQGDEYILKRIREEGMYAVKRTDLEMEGQKRLLTTFPPRGVSKLEALGYEVMCFHLHLDEMCRLHRMSKRGDGIQVATQRIVLDREESTIDVARRILTRGRIHVLDARNSIEELATDLDRIVRCI
jgi:thymidylate kinase